MVTMMTAIGSSPMSGRSTTRSIVTPSAAAAATPATTATASGKRSSTKAV
jgi:hypothetical protein